ncbi:unnamed protein product, partial [Ectocarpus sp. 13 AM-2016]
MPTTLENCIQKPSPKQNNTWPNSSPQEDRQTVYCAPRVRSPNLPPQHLATVEMSVDPEHALPFARPQQAPLAPVKRAQQNFKPCHVQVLSILVTTVAAVATAAAAAAAAGSNHRVEVLGMAG